MVAVRVKLKRKGRRSYILAYVAGCGDLKMLTSFLVNNWPMRKTCPLTDRPFQMPVGLAGVVAILHHETLDHPVLS